jgi:hypothetical protein
MRKFLKTIPEGIKYLSELDNYELPNGILDKGIPNCGATTLALKDNHKTIIASPRNELLKNKAAQTPEAFLALAGMPKEDIKQYISGTSVPKILVTYDSLGKVLDCIENLSDWRVVIDEMQYVITDGSFKSETEMELIRRLKSLPYVTFLTATPCMDELLEQIDIFKDIDFYKLEWTNIDKVKVIRRKCPNPIKVGVRIINEYKKGIYPNIDVSGGRVYSTECVIFVNSVKNILSLIKTTHLEPDEVNIIVGNPNKNEKEIIAQLGEDFEIGRIPLKGEKHKMFTFCTSTAFAGCDFYSTCASTFVLSDCKRVNTTIDIATDLVQIAGRQRLDCNPFRKHLYFIFNTGNDDDNLEEIKSKEQSSRKIVDHINKLDDEQVKAVLKQNFQQMQRSCKYFYSYVMIKDETSDAEFNVIAYVSDQYEYMVKTYQYENGISIKRELENSNFELNGNQVYCQYEEQLDCIVAEEPFDQRMKRYCDARDNCKGMLLTFLDIDHPEFKSYYEQLGSKRIRALGYKEKTLKEEIASRSMFKCVCLELNQRISDGDRLTTENIKSMLGGIYAKLGMKKTAKATDLQNLYGYDIKECKVTMDDGGRKGGYIINKKVE